MATTNRASLLNGLRTGGVRSSSMSAPLSPAPATSFNLPRFSSSAINSPIFPEEEDMDHLSDLLAHNLYINNSHPFTAPIDPTNTSFVHQQAPPHRPLNPNSVPFSPAHLQQQQQSPADAQLHAYQQMQLMQLEILRLQVRPPPFLLISCIHPPPERPGAAQSAGTSCRPRRGSSSAG